VCYASTTELGKNGPALSITQEQAVRDFLLDFECESLDASRLDRVLNRVTADIRYHVNAWDRPFVGQDAVREELLRQAPGYHDFRSEILAMASVDQTVLVERRDSMVLGGKPVTIHVAGVFEVDAEGKISAWRDYYDRKELDSLSA
jgi:limonene-1,2-epoxide hydrolase